MLENFFTLTETKDGLAATSRVEELVTVMQREKDCIVNPADAIRQWTAVAGIITRTGYNDCLDLFVQLGGLLFIDRWLKDAENYGSNIGDNFVEESITAFLLALERLCIDKDKSISSGIWVTVSHLLGHHSAKVQDRARAVFDNWNHGDRGNDAVCQKMEESAVVNDWTSVSKDVGNVGRQIGEAECSAASISSRGEKEDVESNASEAMSIDNLPLQSSNATIPERVEDVQQKHAQIQLRSKMVLETCDESISSLLSSAAMPGHDLGGTSDGIKDVQKYPAGETTSVETCRPDVPHGNSFSKADTVPISALSEDMKPVDKLGSGQKNLSSSGATRAFELANVSEADALTSEQIAAVSSVGTNVGVDESNICTEAASVSDLRVSVAKPQMEMAEVPTAIGDSGCCLDTAKNSPDKKAVSEKLDHISESHLSKEVDAAAKCKETVRDGYREVSNLSALYGGRRGSKHSNKVCSKKSTIQLEYGILDALGIARQVAKEVEREAADYKEPLSSTSSERSSGGRIGDSRSSCSADSSSGEVSTGQSQSAEGDRRSSTRSGNGDSETEDLVEDAVESSHMTEVKVKTEKDFCEFDLNEEVCSDDGGNKTLLDEEFNIRSSRGLKYLEIDLNMAEDGEDASESLVTENIVPVSSNVNSKGSSVEANQVRSERFNLDLNSTGNDDDDVVISNSHHFNGHDCKSPASSSSQMRPHERNFDLNDRPHSSFSNSFSDRALHHNSPSTGAMSLGKSTLEPFISIMGTKVGISRDDFIPQRSSHLHNGKAIFEPSSGAALGLGPTVSSLHSPMTRCSTMPTEQTVLFSLAPYGPSDRTHCVVDPQVGQVLPGALGPAEAQYPPYPVPFMMSLNTGPSQPQLNLNSGFTVDGANQDPRFLMQLFPPSHVKSTAEYPSAFFQPFHGSIIGAKRKEPEDGLELYPIAYGQHQSPWK